jgi:hypothetical protein
MGTLEYLPYMPCIMLVVIISRLQVLHAELTVACTSAVPARAVSAAPSLAGFHHTKIMAPRPSPSYKLVKTPIRVNSPGCGVSDVCNTVLDEVEHTYSTVGTTRNS